MHLCIGTKSSDLEVTFIGKIESNHITEKIEKGNSV